MSRVQLLAMEPTGIDRTAAARWPSCLAATRGPPGAYAGIGARETPAETLRQIEAIAGRMAAAGWTLRTGLSPGADQAFYRGALAADGMVELFLPEPGFEDGARIAEEGDRVRVLAEPTEAARRLAPRFHYGWQRLDSHERDLRARDVHEVLAESLKDPAALIICWTADGSLDGSEPSVGGTAQALRVAHRHQIPVLNLARETLTPAP
jgi:hypothetical protein